MLLDNRSDEISPPLQAKLDYVRSQLQEDVTQMLYYAATASSDAARFCGLCFLKVGCHKKFVRILVNLLEMKK